MAKNFIKVLAALGALFAAEHAHAAITIPLTVTLSEAVTVTGSPQIAVDVGGTARYAVYSGGTGTNTLTFTLSPQAGDVDLDGIAVASPILLNGGTIKDSAGNDLSPLTFTPPNTAGIKINYPSLSMDFVYDADGRYTLNGTAYNDLTSFLTASGGTFSRASVGTYYDSAGTLQTASSGTPRFDWDPVTHAAKGILIEESRTNLLQRSAQLDNAYWGKANASIVADTTTGPDGAFSSEKFIENASSSKHEVYNLTTIPVISGTSYTFTVYAKAGERTNLHVEISTSLFGANITNYNLQSGTVISGAGSMVSVGGGYYRCQKTVVATSSGNAFIYLSTGNGVSNNYLGDGSSGLYIWGAQFEQGAFPTSYIPTTSAAVTRAADVLTVNTAGWYAAGAGSIFSQGFQSSGASTTGSMAEMWQDAGNKISCRASYDLHTAGGVGQANIPMGLAQGSTQNQAFAYNTNDFSAAKNGAIIGIDTSGSIITAPTLMRVGNTDGNASYYYNGWIAKVKYYPARVPDVQLQLLTQ